MLPLRRRGTSTSSSGFSRTSTAASTPVVTSLRVNRKRCLDDEDKPASVDLYYRAVVYPTKETWDMLAMFSNCEVIGRGSYGEVVRAEALEEFGCSVAIKRVDILEDDQANDWENGLRLLREIFFLRNLCHTNLSSLLCIFPNIGPDLKQVHLVTRYFEQGSLSQFPPVDSEEILDILRQVMSGLAYMHSHGVLHRDVKRENIFIERIPKGGLHVVLGDFGLSRCIVRGGMTAEVVTKPYRCPSLLLGATRYGAEIDVYAAGLVLLEMLTGKLDATLLPNRKMGLKNFIRHQLALSWPSVDISGRLLALSEEMHLDIEEVIEMLGNEVDFEDKLAMEWGRQTWSTVAETYNVGPEVLALARRMTSFDPSYRCSIDCAIKHCGGIEQSNSVRTDVRETFDEEISALQTDEDRARAIKETLKNLMKQDPVIGEEPVSRRTRSQMRLRSVGGGNGNN
jgi:serine/threonine protein kinase